MSVQRPELTMDKGSSPRLQEATSQIAEIAGEMGLRPFPTRFFKVPSHIMYQFAAYGLPGGFPHWTHGKSYHQMKTMYDHGLSRIYELVINTNPSWGFWLENNSNLANQVVSAHVLGHSDFFRNNRAFEKTDRKILEIAQAGAKRIEGYEYRYGEEVVEQTLDAALTLDLIFDHHNPTWQTAEDYVEQQRRKAREATNAKLRPANEYDDLLEADDKKEEAKEVDKWKFPFEEESDLLYILGKFSPKPLEDWQMDCINIVRMLSIYFLPQGLTKIMNEGWATLWHTKIMRVMSDRGFLTEGEHTDYASMHAGVVASGRGLNPYEVGLKVWEDIERRSLGIVDPDREKITRWTGEKIEEPPLKDDIWFIREAVTSDQAFLANYLTPSLIAELGFFDYGQKGNDLVITDRDPAKIKEWILKQYVNFGMPTIAIAAGGADWNRNRELYLKHSWEGQDLDQGWAGRTLKQLYFLWGRPVHIETRTQTNRIVLSCKDGNEIVLDSKLII